VVGLEQHGMLNKKDFSRREKVDIEGIKNKLF